MTREEAIKALKGLYDGSEAILMAIEALKHERTDEWCTDCKEYDTEKKCCPRFNRVIRGAMKREPSEDGTLEVKVEDATKIGRVLISDDEHRGGLYYPDKDEPKGDDLISRTEAINALYDKGSSMTAWGELLAMKWSDIQKCIEQLPSADRPRGEWISKEELIDAIKDAEFVYDGDEDGHKEHDISEMVRVIFKDIIDNLPSADMRGGTE